MIKCSTCGAEYLTDLLLKKDGECHVCGACLIKQLGAEQKVDFADPFPPDQEPNTFLLEIIIDDDKVAGYGGSPRAVMWLQGVIDRQKAYLSELADYGRTVKRLNGLVEELEGELEELKRSREGA